MGVGLEALTELHVCMEQQKRDGCSYNRHRIWGKIMMRSIQSGNFSHSGRGKRLANEITAGIFQFSSSSFLCALFGSFSLSNLLLSSDTLCGKLKPQTTTLRNSKRILSARPTPPSPPLLPAHALGSGPGLGSVTEMSGWLKFQLWLAPTAVRGMGKDWSTVVSPLGLLQLWIQLFSS